MLRFVGFLPLVFSCLSVLSAQNPYGRITGRVMDSAGALVPGAQVQTTHVETNIVTSTRSNAEGNESA